MIARVIRYGKRKTRELGKLAIARAVERINIDFWANFYRALGKKNAVFLWIPKTAGTSLFSILNENGCPILKEIDLISRTFPQRGMVTFGHMDYRQLVFNGYIRKRYDRSAFKFCFIRNPYSRVVSLFHYLKKLNSLGAIGDNPSFLDFCRHLATTEIEPIGLYNVRGLSQCNPQVRWTEGIDVDFVGRVETMEQDSAAVLAELNIKNTRIPHLNRTQRSHHVDYYCDETVDFVREFYREDFEQFGYSFELKRKVA